ncbi:MAG: hypothetical protein HY553_17305 [Elusimicrobia bacterium]|nr:hypothetical protein [Elusimicrobiota bacterium]
MLFVPGLELVHRDDPLFVGTEDLLAGGHGLLELLLQALLARRDIGMPLGQEVSDAVYDLLAVAADPPEKRHDEAVEFNRRNVPQVPAVHSLVAPVAVVVANRPAASPVNALLADGGDAVDRAAAIAATDPAPAGQEQRGLPVAGRAQADRLGGLPGGLVHQRLPYRLDEFPVVPEQPRVHGLLQEAENRDIPPVAAAAGRRPAAVARHADDLVDGLAAHPLAENRPDHLRRLRARNQELRVLVVVVAEGRRAAEPAALAARDLPAFHDALLEHPDLDRGEPAFHHAHEP